MSKKAKKVMKKVEVKTQGNRTAVEVSRVRKLIQPFLKKYGLILNETKHGALQWRRDGDVIMATRREAFKVVLPKDEIAKIAPGARSCEGNHHMSWVPYGEVSKKLILAKLHDKRSNAQVEKAVYGNGISEARQRYLEAHAKVNEAAKKAAKAKKTKKVAKTAKTVKAKKKTKKTKKVPARLAAKVARAAA